MKEKQSKCSVDIFLTYTKGYLQEQAPERLIFFLKRKLQTIYKRLFTLCYCLKTKESYDRWVTRRVWGFRHQISKAKNLKMSVAHIGKFQENTTTLYTERKNLRVSAIRGSGHVWLGKLKRPPLPSDIRHRMWNIRRKWNVDRTEFRI